VSAALDNKPHEMIKKNFVNYGLQLNKYSIFFFTTFVMNHTVETAANDLGRSGKYGFLYLESIKNFITFYCNLHESLPWELKLPPECIKSPPGGDSGPVGKH